MHRVRASVRTTNKNARTYVTNMARVIVALCMTSMANSLQSTSFRRALAPTHTALHTRAKFVTPHAVSCPEADALLAQAKHLRDQAEIQERQLNALKAEAKPQAVEGKNNILPLERLKAW